MYTKDKLNFFLHKNFRNYMSKDHNDDEFMKKINQKIINDEDLNDDLNDLSLEGYIKFITNYLKLNDYIYCY